MRKIVARISTSFVESYPETNSRFPQRHSNRVPMPIVKYPRGIPDSGETCSVLITQEDRWFYNRFHAAALAAADSPDVEIDPETLMRPENKYGTRTVIRVYRLDPPAETPASFELLTWMSDGKNTALKSVPHDEPPPDCEELAGGVNSGNGTHWTRIAVLLRKEKGR